MASGTSGLGSQQASVQQTYPGGVDQTYTGSVASSGGILNRGNVVARPQGDVNSGGYAVASAPAQPVYNAPMNAGTDGVQRSSLGTPSSAPQMTAQAQLPSPSSPGVEAAQPIQQPVTVAGTQPSTSTSLAAPAAPAPLPTQAPSERLAVLPQQPKLKEQDAGSQTASADAQNRSSSSGGSYTVVAGDTINGIARKTGVPADTIKQANGLSSGLIKIGQTLTIPAGGVAAPVQVAAAAPKTDQTTTSAVTKPEVTAYQPPQQSQNLVEQVSLDNSAAPDASGISRMRWPVRGRVISNFGGSGGTKSDGIDIAVPEGTPVKAAENGVVIYAGDGLKEFGNTVLVRHEDGLVTVYGHASEIKVQRGQKVRRGEDIALAGMSGSADSPRLHFEVRKDSSPVDPSTFLE